MPSGCLRTLCAFTALIAIGTSALAAEPYSGAWWNQAEQIDALQLTAGQRSAMEKHLVRYSTENRKKNNQAKTAAAELYNALAIGDSAALDIATTKLSLLSNDAISRQSKMTAAILGELKPLQQITLLESFPKLLPRFWKNTSATQLLAPRLSETSLSPESRPTTLDTRPEQMSQSGQYSLSLEGNAQAQVPLHTIQNWVLRLNDASGAPVSGAKLTLVATMPEHGHGMTTEARVSSGQGPGLYQVEGVNFHMPGWWQITVSIRDGDSIDLARFNLAIGES